MCARIKTGMKKVKNYKGFTLVELVVVMGIFIIIMIISTYAFENILKRSGQMGKSAESEISGMLGLEMMRADIAAAGYGLPWVFPNGVVPGYTTEVTSAPANVDIVAASFNAFNDDPSNPPAFNPLPNGPRAIISGTGGTTGIDYIVVKGTVLGMSKTARKWNYVNYATDATGTTNISYLLPKADPATDLANSDTDHAITIASTFTTTGTETKKLVVGPGTTYAFEYPVPLVVSPNPGPLVGSNFQPTDQSQMFVSYGVSNGTLRMPYNRVDLYVDKATAKPASCCSGTGVLTKAVADHKGGWGGTVMNPLRYPLLDCVGDMQVSYDRDMNNDGNITLIDDTVIGAMSAPDIRTQIKNVRVYILAHEGKKDPSFSYPVNNTNNVICVGPYQPDGITCSSVGRSWTQTNLTNTFGADWQHYRWKVYYFVVNLKNLQ